MVCSQISTEIFEYFIGGVGLAGVTGQIIKKYCLGIFFLEQFLMKNII